jgi:hypothetical protein
MIIAATLMVVARMDIRMIKDEKFFFFPLAMRLAIWKATFKGLFMA